MYIQIAPMEGVVDHVVRALLTEIGGLDRTVTEFVRVTNQLHPAKTFYKYCPELAHSKGRTPSGIPVFVQLLGSDPVALGENADFAVDLGAPGIDLNFGCPAKTVNRHDGGATLLKNPERIFKAIEGVKRAVRGRVPVTAKVRLGFSDKNLCKDIAQAADGAMADQLVVHARTRDEGYRPPAHWEYIAKMKDVVKLPVIANGDLWSVDDYRRCREVSGLKDVALGRSIMARPDLALLLRADSSGKDVIPLPWSEVFTRFLMPLFEIYYNHSLGLAIGRIKQTLKGLSRNFPEAQILFDEIKVLTDGPKILLVLRRRKKEIENGVH